MVELGISVNLFRNIYYKKREIFLSFFYRIKTIINLYIIIMRIGKKIYTYKPQGEYYGKNI